MNLPQTHSVKHYLRYHLYLFVTHILYNVLSCYFIFVRCRNILRCHHWLFLWYLILLDSPVLQKNLIECICQRFQCIFSFDWFQLAFPNGDRMPAHSGKFMLNFQISFLVPLYFVDPKLCIGFWNGIILATLMPMPETTIYKDTSSVLPHHYVWFPRQSWMV